MKHAIHVTKATIPNEDPINNPQGTGILIRWGLTFNQAGTNSAMTHVLDWSAKVRRTERSKRVMKMNIL